MARHSDGSHCMGSACNHVDHLYRQGGQAKHEPEFEQRYGKTHGDYVYGAVVGELKRKRERR